MHVHPRSTTSDLLVDTTQYLQLLILLARQKAPASCLEEKDIPGHQLLSLPLQPGNHTCLEENLGAEEKARVRHLPSWVSGVPLRAHLSSQAEAGA